MEPKVASEYRLTEPSPSRILPMRLKDVPEADRIAAAREACRTENDPWARLEIMLLATNPPDDLIAWVRP